MRRSAHPSPEPSRGAKFSKAVRMTPIDKNPCPAARAWNPWLIFVNNPPIKCGHQSVKGSMPDGRGVAGSQCISLKTSQSFVILIIINLMHHNSKWKQNCSFSSGLRLGNYMNTSCRLTWKACFLLSFIRLEHTGLDMLGTNRCARVSFEEFHPVPVSWDAVARSGRHT